MIEQQPESNYSYPLDQQGWQELLTSFEEIELIKDPIRKEYELIHAAQKFNLPLDNYVSLFEKYNKEQLKSQGLKAFSLLKESPTKAIKQGLDILSRLSLVSMVGVVFYFGLELFDALRTEEYVGWILLALNQDKPGNNGRSFALKNLNEVGANLTGINLEQAVLPQIDLQEANLFFANFKQANLYQANLENANLENADLSEANLTGANLTGTNLTGANLSGTNLEKAIGLTAEQVKKAENWQEAIFAPDFQQILEDSESKPQ